LPTDADLLALETETAFGLDERGRLVSDRLLVRIGVARDGLVVKLGTTLPDHLVEPLERAAARAPGPASLEARPPALNRCQALLESEVGALDVAVDLCYIIPAGTRYDSGVEVARSIDGRASELRAMNPGNWEAEEWDDLLDGKLGPWAMAVDKGRVISICHTPVRMNDRAAEAGVWTDPDFRGRGHAAAVTAAWSAIPDLSGRHLLYSTTEANLSSQRVAARLKLRLIGRVWDTRALIEA
jgi:hypothetical protein